jgi:hypothetical protein
MTPIGQTAPDRNLILDELDERLERFRVFRKTDSAEADKVLDELGASDAVDRRIVLELSGRRALGHLERFPEAHALAIQALEVLDRNGAAGVKLRGLGPLSPVGGFLVQLVARFIVRSYQATVIDQMRHLYGRREARCLPGDPARPPLTRARQHAERLAPGFKRNPLGLPTFLLGGAVVSGVASGLRALVALVSGNRVAAIVGTLVLALVFGAAAWIILRGAAVARRRIKLTVEAPLQALWETIGRAGNPPKDQSRQFALYALVLTAVSWVVIPLGVSAAIAAL